MRFDWDLAKARANIKRHRISFDTAIQVFDDPFSFTIPDRIVDDEERLWTIGRIGSLLVVVVVHTICDEEGEDVFRIISARKATPEERYLYEESKTR